MEFETLKKSHLKKNITLGVVAVLIISAIVLTFTRARYRVTQSIPLVNGTINYTLPDIQIVGLYINGVEAEELDSTKSYTLDTTQSTCTYKDGTAIDNLTLSYDSDTKTFTIAPYTTKGTKCTLYFDEEPTAADTIEDLYPNNQDMLAYDDYGNIRYIGANPNNYVLFNDELWRIIGIFSEDTHGVGGEKLIKIIRNEFIDGYAYDLDENGLYDNNWNTSTLQELLNNGAYWNKTTGIYYEYDFHADAPEVITVDFTTSGLADEAKAMIETVTWKLGGTANYTSSSNGLTSHWYNYERGTTVYSGRPTTWNGKVALMYPSDYGYATSGGATTNRETCLAKELYDWWYDSNYSECHSGNWLYERTTHRTLTPFSGNSYYTFSIDPDGLLFTDEAFYGDMIKPSVYLKTLVSITDGDGSEQNPYILAI